MFSMSKLGQHQHRTHPDHIYTQGLYIVELLGDTWDIADSIVIAIIEGCWINLIYSRFLPPRMLAGLQDFATRLSACETHNVW